MHRKGENPRLSEKITKPLTDWYHANRRDLPWRNTTDPYRIWVSEIMLQQTRVETVIPYYLRFLETLPDIPSLADAQEDVLLKLWEGLGYYSRVRNMQKAARILRDSYGGRMPADYDVILSLPGIGSYTAGAIASFAYGISRPAVDGNVLRVYARLTGYEEDITLAKTKTHVEHELEQIIPKDEPGDFNQALIELGALICTPGVSPKCEICLLYEYCTARAENRQGELPVRKSLPPRRIEKRTILLFKDEEKLGIRKRPEGGLLSGLYEPVNLAGHLNRNQVAEYAQEIGLSAIRIQKLVPAKHIFSHVEWHMIGYEIRVDELEKNCKDPGMLFIHPGDIKAEYPIPSAYASYMQNNE